MKLFKVCFTGGPCGGKTTIIPLVQKKLCRFGFSVVIIPEAASSLANVSEIPVSDYEFENKAFSTQLKRECCLNDNIKDVTQSSIVLLDRGLLDQVAFMGIDQYSKMISLYGLSITQLMQSYNVVIHLPTLAMTSNLYDRFKGDRIETREEAIKIDSAIRSFWCNSPYYYLIDYSLGINEKVNDICDIILKNI